MEFTRFRHLPPEIRLKIFSHTLPAFHIVPLEVLYINETGFNVEFDHEAIADLPLMTAVSIRGLTHACRDLRKMYLDSFPDHIFLTGSGSIHINYRTTIVYLHSLDKLVAQPAISRTLFDRNTTSRARFTPIIFPEWFSSIKHLALPIDCIVELPEACPYPLNRLTDHVERALFAKMLSPFRNLQCLSAVPDDYWRFDIHLTRNGIFQRYPDEVETSILGKLARRIEQLLLWAEYKNSMLTCKGRITAGMSRYVEPKLTIWGMEDLDLWAFLNERDIPIPYNRSKTLG